MGSFSPNGWHSSDPKRPCASCPVMSRQASCPQTILTRFCCKNRSHRTVSSKLYERRSLLRANRFQGPVGAPILSVLILQERNWHAPSSLDMGLVVARG